MDSNIHNFLVWLALPAVGLPAVFLVCLVSATLLPMGSEPALFAYIKLNPEMFWIAIFIATLGNTVGGMINWIMGYGAIHAHDKIRGPREHRLMGWFERLGPPALLLSWLPIVGDPLCAVAGWLKLPWLPCMIYMAIGKFLRYLTMTYFLMMVPDDFWIYLKNLFMTIFGAWFN